MNYEDPGNERILSPFFLPIFCAGDMRENLLDTSTSSIALTWKVEISKKLDGCANFYLKFVGVGHEAAEEIWEAQFSSERLQMSSDICHLSSIAEPP